MKHLKIGFVGGGNMARALVGGLVTSGYPKELITVANRGAEKLEALKKDFGINTTLNNAEAVKNADVVILAVKPQVMAEVLSKFINDVGSVAGKLIISLAAGITTERLKSLLAGHDKIIRLMPNTPALIGQGATGMFKTSAVNDEEKAFAQEMLEAVGSAVWVDNEQDINAVTAISGSSPAYFFLFMEYLVDHGVKMGLTTEQAKSLAVQTALGSAALALKKSDVTLQELRAQVTSKGGTTFAAITKFEEMNLRDLVAKAMDVCANRAEEMEKLF